MIRNRSDNIGNDKEEQSDRYQTFEIEENDHDRNMQSEGTKTLSTVAFLTYKKMLISLVILVAVSQVILVLHIFMNKTMSIRTYENPIHYYSDETEHQNGRNHDGNQYYRTNYNNYNGQYYNYNRDNAGESGSYSKNSGYFSWGKSQQHSSNGNGGSQYSNGNHQNRGGNNQNRNSNNGSRNRNGNWNRNGSGSTYGTQKKVNPIPH
ncbi:predicted protein [Chaetoceros tenuissimus]|uniref:Uncharacterized protein n=1 Tax=Chaetoceros tenuissimus TaxID=426638 RepID=A0AAD3D3M9_9STRA|nr:predicted protein [Chaetoceros tenuissimus]